MGAALRRESSGRVKQRRGGNPWGEAGAWWEVSLKQTPESGVTAAVLCVILKATMTLSRKVTQTLSAWGARCSRETLGNLSEAAELEAGMTLARNPGFRSGSKGS